MKTLFRTAVTAAALAMATTACTSAATGQAPVPKVTLDAVRLVAYDSCDDMLSGLREHAAENVGPWGFGGPQIMYMEDTAATARAKTTSDTPEHSTTNVHEAGVDEPDLVKTDGNRIVTVVDGTLRVIDTATKKVTASLKLTKKDEPTFAPADLLLSGDRALVLFRGGDIMVKSFAPPGETRYVVVDLAGQPKVLSTIRAQGSYVDARMIGSTVRLVTRSQPDITFPEPKNPDASEADRKKANQDVVRRAPLSAWLPTVEITGGSGAVKKDTVRCERVSHPADYTGTSLLTVHSIDLTQDVAATGTEPISLAADGDTVYGSGTSLYVASNPRWWFPVVTEPMPVEPVPTATDGAAPAVEPTPSDPPVTADPTVTTDPTVTAVPAVTSSAPATPATSEPVPTPTAPPEETEVHRFDISAAGAPSYVASGKVPGRLLNQYSLSEYEGHLRVATTLTSTDGGNSASSVYVLDAATMAKAGEVGGLGKGERIYSVRFIGPVGYVVTFKQVDPLYTLDLRDPAAPKVTGELKITGYSAYLHPGADGRLIGIGQEASDKGRTLGTQVSLFDVSDPAAPRRLSQLFQKESGSEAEWDPHAFLYWPKTGLSVLPLMTPKESGALVLKIDDSAVKKLGMIKHPTHQDKDYTYQPGIQRSIVIGDAVWTLSWDGLQVNDATTLARQAWIPLR
ncbi:beta-propeller domain-containing protein [Nonomuraea sp. NPDC001636]|uniref:beta-propeller domain-containing protein n=1 Tax=Nonomuraea sp. NPDC001636 TaxID=3154391 RepID=UPI0033307E58